MRRLWLIIAILFTIGGFASIGLLTMFHKMPDTSKTSIDWAIVFDAGSSGTRMFIYNWKAGFSASRGDPLVVTQNHTCRPDDKGIDKIKNQQEFIKRFQKCFDEANTIIPEDRKNRTFISLAATAGMRLLRSKNETAADNILNFIRDYFKQTKFLFKNESQVRIITGQEEGTNAWISANYFLNKFKPGADPLDTTGILDLGGASTQIVYVPKNPNLQHENFFSELKIYGVSYKPYSNSYLCWGINEINLLYRTYLMKKASLAKTINAPCYPANVTYTLNTNDIFNSPCANGLVFNHTYNFTVNVNDIRQNEEYTLVGTSDMKECKDEVAVLFPEPKCTYESCSFDDVYQPPVTHHDFTAFSNFFHAINNTQGIMKESFNRSFDWFVNATDIICSKTIDELRELNKINNVGINDKFLLGMCFANNFVIKLWKSYGFKDLDHMVVTEKVKGYSVGWTLGYLINDLNRDDFLPHEVPPSKLSKQYYVPLLILAICLTTIFFAIIIFVLYKISNKQRGMIPLSQDKN